MKSKKPKLIVVSFQIRPDIREIINYINFNDENPKYHVINRILENSPEIIEAKREMKEIAKVLKNKK